MNNKWNLENIPDLKGKVIIVTGGNSGLGYESVKAFAQKGAEVIIACRSLEKGLESKNEILKDKITGKIEVMELDLMDLSSIENFAEAFKSKYSRLDVLLNNAGIMMTPYFLTKNGFEAQMGTNHLGHYALTGRLIDIIKKTPQSRVVNVSSGAHKSGIMDFDNLLFENGKGYGSMKSYGRSKLANLLFTYELQRKFETENIDSISVAAHPGVARTNLAKHLENKLIFKILRPLLTNISQESAQGALPQIRASVDPSVKGAEYYGPDGKGERKGLPVQVQSNEASYNKEDAEKLWDVSRELTGVTIL